MTNIIECIQVITISKAQLGSDLIIKNSRILDDKEMYKMIGKDDIHFINYNFIHRICKGNIITVNILTLDNKNMSRFNQ